MTPRSGDRPLPRFLSAAVDRSLESFPVVVVTGARQVGKSTMIRELLRGGDRAYHTLDDLDVRDRLEREPAAFLAGDEPMTIDEIQRVPAALLSIKRSVDEERRPGRFLLSGSANLALMAAVADALPGRARYIAVSPMTVAERGGHGRPSRFERLFEDPNALEIGVPAPARSAPASIDWEHEVRRGGLPPAALMRSDADRAAWFEGYVAGYLERDLRQLAAVQHLADFQRLMRIVALRLGCLQNQTDLGRDAGLPQATAHRYLNLMEASYLIHRLAPFTANRARRLIRTPKAYFTDTGLAAFLAGAATTGGRAPAEALRGALLENLVLSELLAWRETRVPRPGVHFWRTVSGAEVDFVVEDGDRLLPIEVKASARVRLSDATHLESFLDEYADRAPRGIILYTGTRIEHLTCRTTAVPLSVVLGVE